MRWKKNQVATRLSPCQDSVLAYLLAHDQNEYEGHELAGVLRLPRPEVYADLYLLESYGLLSSREQTFPGRKPPRILYRISRYGLSHAAGFLSRR